MQLWMNEDGKRKVWKIKNAERKTDSLCEWIDLLIESWEQKSEMNTRNKYVSKAFFLLLYF